MKTIIQATVQNIVIEILFLLILIFYDDFYEKLILKKIKSLTPSRIRDIVCLYDKDTIVFSLPVYLYPAACPLNTSCFHQEDN